MGKKLYVGNLSYTVTEETLHSMFSAHGNVDSAKLITDRDTGRSKGFAFVEMSTDAEATKAIENLNGTEQYGRSMNVSEAKPMEPKSDRGGSRGGGGGGGFRGSRY